MKTLTIAVAGLSLAIGCMLAPVPAEAGKGTRFSSGSAAGTPAAAFQKRQTAQPAQRPSPSTASLDRPATTPAAGTPDAAFQSRQASQSPLRPSPPTTTPSNPTTTPANLRLGQVGRSSCGGKMIVVEPDGTETVRCQRRQ